jgi:hypothetical protein
MATKSPTQRTKAELQRRGAKPIAIVERWNSFAKIRQDLYGCIDILCVLNGRVLGIQASTAANRSARLEKALKNENLPFWLTAADFELWSWKEEKRPGKKTLATFVIDKIGVQHTTPTEPQLTEA